MAVYAVTDDIEQGANFSLTDILDPQFAIAEQLSDDARESIGNTVVKEHGIDVQSRSEWLERNQAAIRLAMQLREDKTSPWGGASNVKFPLLTIGAIQFHTRAYPNIVTESPVMCKVFGKDMGGLRKARASRIATHMSYQLLEEDDDWEEQFDALLLSLSITGCEFEKTYWDPIGGHPVTRWVSCADLVVPYYAASLREASRATHEIRNLKPRDAEERMRAGLWREVELATAVQLPDEEGKQAERNRLRGQTEPSDDVDAPCLFLEQHRFLDLDGDGYTEPYIVTVEKKSAEVLRIVPRFTPFQLKTDADDQIGQVMAMADQRLQQLQQAGMVETMRAEADTVARRITQMRDKAKVLSIKPVDHFTRYVFLPSIDGGVYGRGLGDLIGHLTEAASTLVNQLVDAGTLANSNNGFIGRGAKFGKGGRLEIGPREWVKVQATGDDLRKNIVPLPKTAPSAVLFNLLGLLIEYTERTMSVTDTMTGQLPGQNTPATTSQIAQAEGMAVFTGIFKRVLRSLRTTFRQRYRLNRDNLDPRQYVELMQGDAAMLMSDYKGDDRAIRPAADPNMVTDQQRIMQAQALKQDAMQTPGYDTTAVQQRYLRAIGIDDTEEVYPTQQDPETGRVTPVIPPPPNPEFEVQVAEEQRRTLEAQNRDENEKAKIQIQGATAEIEGIYKKALTMKVAEEADMTRFDRALQIIEQSTKEADERKDDSGDGAAASE